MFLRNLAEHQRIGRSEAEREEHSAPVRGGRIG
jgi:hypothetical protein